MATIDSRSNPPPDDLPPLNPYAHPGARLGAQAIIRDIHSLTSTMVEAVDFYGPYDPMVYSGLALIETWERYAKYLSDLLECA